jgi:hypothetical protein
MVATCKAAIAGSPPTKRLWIQNKLMLSQMAVVGSDGRWRSADGHWACRLFVHATTL